MKRNNAYHICLGTPQNDLDELKRDAERGETYWTINSKAKKNDYALIYMIAPVSSIVARGVVLTDAERDTDPNNYWYRHFECHISDLEMLANPVPLAEIRRKIPEWGYWKTPIKSTRVPDNLAGKIERLLDKSNNQETIVFPDVDEIDVSVKEGRRRLALHFKQERNQKIVRDKKAQVLREKGKLKCEACGFDFREMYGDLGKDYCEVHHKKPLSKLERETKTRLTDLAVLCSNCHRMIHRKKSLLSISALKKSLKG